MKLPFARRLLAAMLVAIPYLVQLSAYAEESAKSTPLSIEGGVKGTAVSFDQGVSYINSASMNIERATELIIRDAMRQQPMVLRGPNVLPNGTVIPPINSMTPVGEVPIHKTKVERWLSASQQNFSMLQSYVDGLIIPPGKARLVEPAYTQLRGVVDFANLHLQRLKDLLAEKDLSNKQIAREAFFIHDAMQDIRKRAAAISGVINGTTSVPAPGEGVTVSTTHRRVTTNSEGSTSSGLGHNNSDSTSTTTTEEQP
ncbi:MAG TPA: hypothetical protein V6D22_16765 [Candidatus Obscuribacterales bacterium]